ncbi:MAG: phosphate acyltransferase PlsX [Clostridia bacterium]|nr:phosphate acyltransferase PlsX [Clostridia bacterium]MBP3651691.1 phosphate acyltransferase PlsX [Clostridia bacterium]
MSRYVIALDAMGGDNAPNAIVEGAIRGLRKFKDIEIMLTGPEEKLAALIADANDVKDRISIVNATEVITMEDSPMMAVRTKKDSSLVVAMNAVREGRAGAVVSAGSTGALLAGGMFKVGRIPGIERPALAPILPGLRKNFMLIDCGANVDCQPKYLLQFGMMGSVYMKSVLDVKNPNVGLVNIGAEAEKGNKLVKETYELMQQQSGYNFVGNCEARDIFTGDFDVVVADGFAGNIILKHTEGLAKALFTMIKEELMASLGTKIGAMLAKPAFRKVKKRMDYNAVGGAPLLGVNGAVVKAHGSSGGEAIENAIRQARRMLEGDVVGKITEGLKVLDENNQ